MKSPALYHKLLPVWLLDTAIGVPEGDWSCTCYVSTKTLQILKSEWQHYLRKGWIPQTVHGVACYIWISYFYASSIVPLCICGTGDGTQSTVHVPGKHPTPNSQSQHLSSVGYFVLAASDFACAICGNVSATTQCLDQYC